ncbi:hypothetical protein N7468_001503 [Penicillium chermesinum]|uniref:Uncharacterized protein n=1 Tax=Penicillium chermesinum TaxID=63820 RepID=A0A9W9TWU3_9EURO|nr:uncharacterized protein N7468_001503 [Penicillium chermesinum]KAJ5246520.1 hypothetical protein N7468_001503 [Penicillium chermesinum]
MAKRGAQDLNRPVKRRWSPGYNFRVRKGFIIVFDLCGVMNLAQEQGRATVLSSLWSVRLDHVEFPGPCSSQRLRSVKALISGTGQDPDVMMSRPRTK